MKPMPAAAKRICMRGHANHIGWPGREEVMIRIGRGVARQTDRSPRAAFSARMVGSVALEYAQTVSGDAGHAS
jgi:hypothetical protein